MRFSRLAISLEFVLITPHFSFKFSLQLFLDPPVRLGVTPPCTPVGTGQLLVDLNGTDDPLVMGSSSDVSAGPLLSGNGPDWNRVNSLAHGYLPDKPLLLMVSAAIINSLRSEPSWVVNLESVDFPRQELC
uniref:Uncharacterized protein n=1 Tax=Utricularia reniformis TaxID=192314 RepID=A0A1Y0B4I6_9LAMI|nr:hypothetical protein AEK19_MT2153 [Utricularia reniformis]ART32303.1 hypothetical protein AEK19_MT2153 [Utricularia reniformis]